MHGRCSAALRRSLDPNVLITAASVPPARSDASAGSHQPVNSCSDTLRPPQPAAPSNRQHQQAPHSTVCSRGATQPCSSTEAQLQRCRTGSAWERVCGFCAACLCSVITAVHAFIVTQNVRGERTRQPFIHKATHNIYIKAVQDSVFYIRYVDAHEPF